MGNRICTQVVGIDGCPGGWIAVSARDGRFSGLAGFPTVAAVIEAHPDAAVFGIDIPLAFPVGNDPRAAEQAVKKRLGRSSASLFLTPPREVLEAATYDEANRLFRRKYGRGVSRQSYGLRQRVLEAVRFIESTEETRLFEVHPELSFRLLAASQGGEIGGSKKTWNGAAERRTLLGRDGLAPPVEAVPGLGRAAVDDVLDAAVAAWTAQRIATGTAVRFGEHAGSARSGPLDIILA